MGSMASPDPQINSLWFYPISSRIMKFDVIIKIDATTVMCIGKDDRIYTNSRVSDNYHFTIGDWYWQTGVLKALRKLGIISQKQIDTHLSKVDEIVAKKGRLEVVEQIKKINELYDLDLRLPDNFITN